MDGNHTIEQHDGFVSKLKAWFEDNLRVLLSIAIVVAIAGGIYSYSQRAQAPTITGTEEGTVIDSEVSSETAGTIGSGEETAAPQITRNDSSTLSRETETSFVASAAKGEGTTHLARRALADYLAKNPDSQLTAEHKVYIEDYLRKQSGFQGQVLVGTSVEFSKNMIQQAIEKSKQLNEAQLKNLQKYSSRIASF